MVSTQILEPCAATPTTNAPASSSHSESQKMYTASAAAAKAKQAAIQRCLEMRCVTQGVITAASRKPAPEAANALASPARPASTSSGSLK